MRGRDEGMERMGRRVRLVDSVTRTQKLRHKATTDYDLHKYDGSNPDTSEEEVT
jgi:hypothetical protein